MGDAMHTDRRNLQMTTLPQLQSASCTPNTPAVTDSATPTVTSTVCCTQ